MCYQVESAHICLNDVSFVGAGLACGLNPWFCILERAYSTDHYPVACQRYTANLLLHLPSYEPFNMAARLLHHMVIGSSGTALVTRNASYPSDICLKNANIIVDGETVSRYMRGYDC